MNKTVAILFAMSCFATSFASNSILGAGMWFWVIIATGLFVALSQYRPMLRGIGSAAASLLAVIAVCAVVLTLLAATIGGTFRLGDREALLAFSFFLIAVFGFSLARINKKAAQS